MIVEWKPSLATAAAKETSGYARCPGFRPSFVFHLMGHFGDFHEQLSRKRLLHPKSQLVDL
ncbi:hypothetical protein MUY14_37675 [Amycolatopsis sp. FBCC-B4732]|uniref:hypothetical protein n=1 Tax=Amycolatopsis sp. FBCC-B4732 TaxID=3079339 RepID=UPI001FF2F8CC|nr:hypothetical protein [Amycolatopsis sp. FBCC-B4732]UOX87405.1 hypothetical protein MUY14_37675 [Amycolatopsis sp. FBCC-B4732]